MCPLPIPPFFPPPPFTITETPEFHPPIRHSLPSTVVHGLFFLLGTFLPMQLLPPYYEGFNLLSS